MKMKRKGQGETETPNPPTKTLEVSGPHPASTPLATLGAVAAAHLACNPNSLEPGTRVTVAAGATLYLAKTGQAAKSTLRHAEIGVATLPFEALYIGLQAAKGGSVGGSPTGRRALLRRDDFSIVAVEFSVLTRTPALPAKE